MTFCFKGLVPAIALPALALLVSGAAFAQRATLPPSGPGGQMAYPDSLPSGQVRVNAPTARDTGNMALPASQGGVTTNAPTGRDVGNMALPTDGNSVITSRPRRVAGPASSVPAPAMSSAAGQMALQPSTAPVPYTAFDAPAPVHGRGMVMHHRAAAKKSSATATPAK